MDTFFVTKKASKLTRGYTCMQIFVTNKGFIYLVPMQSKQDVYLATKAFAKEIGAPKAIICNPSKEQTSKDVRAFCHKIETTLRVIEEQMQWANLAKLYIGLLKEAVRKDMLKSDCPLCFGTIALSEGQGSTT